MRFVTVFVSRPLAYESKSAVFAVPDSMTNEEVEKALLDAPLRFLHAEVEYCEAEDMTPEEYKEKFGEVDGTIADAVTFRDDNRWDVN